MAKILVIDDDPLVRRLIGRILIAAGHAICEASDGKRGLKLLASEAPDLIITDLVMAEGEGIETILAIRGQNPGIGIIAVSGGGSMGGTGYLDMAVQLGANTALAKPFRAEDLVDRVARLLPLRPAG